MRVVVAGAGIGGLATALSLHAAGITDVTVYEAVEEIRPLGVGIDLLPAAVRELTELGLYDDVAEIAIPTAAPDPAAEHAWSRFTVHRGELQMLLLRAQLAWLGPDSLRTGLELTGYAQTAAGVTVEFGDRAGNLVTEEADVLIAADGIHSAGRALMYPNEGPPTPSGRVVWRGISPAPTPPTGRSTVVADDGARRFVASPIRAAEGDRPALLSWLAQCARADARPAHGDWHRTTEPVAVLRHFGDRAFVDKNFGDGDRLDVPSVIGAAEVAYEHPALDREPLPSWSDGRVTLLGDAARGTYSIDSNGASQAILDARAVARELATHPDPVEALTAYEEQRRLNVPQPNADPARASRAR